MVSSAQVSAILGRYMLQGWTLTDVNCRNENCPGCPLMRSKSGEEFCARCDGGPVEAASVTTGEEVEMDSPVAKTLGRRCETGDSEEIAPMERSGYETPPTPPLNLHGRAGSEVGGEDERLVPIADANLLEARRIQADVAAQRIGKLLLKGWVLLDGHCESEECWAIPLMRTPSRITTEAEGLRRRYCVMCEQDWDSDQARALRQPISSVSVGNRTVPVSAGTIASYLRLHLSNSGPTTSLDPPNHDGHTRSTARLIPPSHPNGPRTVQLVFDHDLKRKPAEPEQVEPISHSHPDPLAVEAAKNAIAESIRQLSTNLLHLTTLGSADHREIASAAEHLANIVELYKKM